MPDPLSITASVVGITVPALHGIRLLLQDLQQVEDASRTVKGLVEDVHSVDTALELLQSVEEREWDLLGTGVTERLKTTISKCTQECDRFRSDLQQWTRHSKDGKLGLKDRVNVGFFKRDQTKAMSKCLQSCKLDINSFVSIATLYSSVRHSHITEDIKKAISVKQNEVKGAIAATDKQLILLEGKMEELGLSSDEEEGKAEALQTFEEQHQLFDASRKMLEELLSKAHEEAVARAAAKNQHSSTTVTSVTFGNQNSGQQAGVINGGTFTWGK